MNLRPTTPAAKQPGATDAQWLLSGHNRFAKTKLPIHTYHGKVDGVYGKQSGHAADRARYWTGYPLDKCNVGGVFRDQLYSYLLPLDSKKARRLPLSYRVRRAGRVKAELARLKKLQSSRKIIALHAAMEQAHLGVHEYGYTNNNKFGIWFGLNRVPWCAEFVSWGLAQGGFHGIKTASAEQFYWWAVRHDFGLSVTFNPEPGDIVVFFRGEGHVGFFVRWIDRSRGIFQTCEGNTSCAGGSWNNGGECCIKTHSLHDGYNPRFVRVPA